MIQCIYTKIVLAVLVLFSFSLSPISMYAASSDLDSTFGIGGKVRTDFFGLFDIAQDLAIQSDGKIVAAGWTNPISNAFGEDFAVARYNSDGSLDLAFGNAGKVTTDFAGQGDFASSIAIQTDGKILVAGTVFGGMTYDFGVARYNLDGSLDTSFGVNGKIITDFFNDADNLNDIAVQNDGKIVLVGTTGNPSNNSYDFALVRYNSNGTLDSSFGTSGKLTTDFFGGGDQALAITIRADGKLIVVGGTAAFKLARYNINGTLDNTFGNGGLVTTSFFGTAFFGAAQDVVTQPDGKIIIGGHGGADSTGHDFTLVRYNANGAVDTSFGNNGIIFTEIYGNSDVTFALALQSDGKVVAGGCIFAEQPVPPGHFGYDSAIVRYNSTGSLDLSFGTGGKSIRDFAGCVYTLAVQPDGKIVGAGIADLAPAVSFDFQLIRYNPATQCSVPPIITAVNALLNSGDISDGTANSLIKKLEGAIKQIERGNNGSAIGELNAFINEVEALIRSRRLSEEKGQPLIDTADCVIASLTT